METEEIGPRGGDLLYQRITEPAYGGPKVIRQGRIFAQIKPLFNRDPEPGEYYVGAGESTWYVRRYPEGDRKKLFGGTRRAWISG